jgi:SAM-dependent methyltransferase
VKFQKEQMAEIVLGMREAFSKGENAMEWCREYLRTVDTRLEGNELLATLIAYDLQAGSYVSAARRNHENYRRWCRQLAALLESVVVNGDSILEVGVGEATTLAGILVELAGKVGKAFGFDVSWSRVAEGEKWLTKNNCKAKLFVADLLNIPIDDDSIDVVYSSHSLEPNRGKEEQALRECLRVARKAVVLIEPIYELASEQARARMRNHGYIEGLYETAQRLGAEVLDYRLLEYSPNPLNPSGVVCIGKTRASNDKKEAGSNFWSCPITSSRLEPSKEVYFASDVGLAYPILQGIPLLRSEHVIVASKLTRGTDG